MLCKYANVTQLQKYNNLGKRYTDGPFDSLLESLQLDPLRNSKKRPQLFAQPQYMPLTIISSYKTFQPFRIHSAPLKTPLLQNRPVRLEKDEIPATSLVL